MNPDILSKREFKIFLTFFLLYAFFVNWPGMDENSRLFLTKAIVDEGRLTIDDSFYNRTGDRAYYQGHYYSDKEPGLSFLAVPVYGTWKFIYYNFFPNPFIKAHNGTTQYEVIHANQAPIRLYKDPGFFYRAGRILVTVFTSSLFSALTVILIYKLSRYFTEKEIYRLLAAVTYGAGSLAFHYGLVFLNHASSTFFIFLAFYIIYTSLKEDRNKKRYYFLAGLSAGFAGVIGLSTIFVSGLLFIYLFFKKRGRTLSFLLGGIIGIFPLLIYNYWIFNSALVLPRYHLDPKVWPSLPGSHGVIFKPFYNLQVMLRLLVFPYRGLLFYYPIFLLSFLGLFFLAKKGNRDEALLITAISFMVLYFASTWWAWWHGACFGPRHLMVMMPFLILPLSKALEKVEEETEFGMSLVFFLLFLSIFNNFMGLQANYEDMLKNPATSRLKSKYQGRLEKFKPLANPLRDYYWPLFLEHGPRSRIFESLVYGRKLDIRGSSEMKENNVPFLDLLPLLLSWFVIWRREILNVLEPLREKL